MKTIHPLFLRTLLAGVWYALLLSKEAMAVSPPPPELGFYWLNKKKIPAPVYEPRLYRKITSHSTIHTQQALRYDNTDIPGSFDFYNNHFQEKVHFVDVNFRASTDFILSTFDKETLFKNAIFHQPISLTWASFEGPAGFNRCQFRASADFANSRFLQRADFYLSRFHRPVSFFRANFMKQVSFTLSTFHKTDFSMCHFWQGANFSKSEFSDELLFNQAILDGQAAINFSEASFGELLSFSGASILTRLDFHGSILPHYLDLSDLREIREVFSLLETDNNLLYPVCYINLLNTDVNKIQLRYDNFRLYFPENTDYEQKCKVYENLLEKFRREGLEKSYKTLDIEYQQFKNNYNSFYVGNFLSALWWDYGYARNRVWLWYGIIIILLTCINALFLESLLKKVYDPPFVELGVIERATANNHPIAAFFHHLPYAFIYTLMLLLGGPMGLGFNLMLLKREGFIGICYVFVVGLIGIVFSAFALNVILKS